MQLSSSPLEPKQFSRLPKSTFRERIVEELRSAIFSGVLAPGSQVTETALAQQFEVSRGPLREALRQLTEEGLLVTIPYTGTHVTSLSLKDVREIYSMRVTLERFAFELTWDRRDDSFRSELHRRNSVLAAAIRAGDDYGSIRAELDLHGLIYEISDHSLLQRAWAGLRGRLQLYWVAHHRAHGTRGPRSDSHDSYLATALGDDLAAMVREISDHMRRGAERTEQFLLSAEPATASNHEKGRST